MYGNTAELTVWPWGTACVSSIPYRVCARWVPRILTAEHLTNRVELSKQFIKKVNRGGIRFLDRIITTDESWFHYYDPETKQQSTRSTEKIPDVQRHQQ
jgi:hypothetical protein